MTTPRPTPWPLLAVLASALSLPACKKQEDSKPPGDAADPGDDADGGGGGGNIPDDDGPDFLTADVFEETVQDKSGDVTDCYAKAKETRPDLAGKLSLDFTIGGDGSVTDVKTDPGSTINDADLNACVLEKTKSWKFPRTRDGNPMTLPFSFNMS